MKRWRALVAGAIVLTESVLRRCGQAERERGRPLTADERVAVVLSLGFSA